MSASASATAAAAASFTTPALELGRGESRVGAQAMYDGAAALTRPDLNVLAEALRIPSPARVSARASMLAAVCVRLRSAIRHKILGIAPRAEQQLYKTLSREGKEALGICVARPKPKPKSPPPPPPPKRASAGLPTGLRLRQTMISEETFIPVNHMTLADAIHKYVPLYITMLDTTTTRTLPVAFSRASPAHWTGSRLSDDRSVCTFRHEFDVDPSTLGEDRCALLYWTIQKDRETVLSWPPGLELTLCGRTLVQRGVRALPVDVTSLLRDVSACASVDSSSITANLTFRDKFVNATQAAHTLVLCICLLDEDRARGLGTAYEGIHFTPEDNEFVAEEEVPLTCPLTMTRINVPARGVSCTHRQCFDLASFVIMMRTSSEPIWKCPACNKVLTPDTLRIDLGMQDIMQSLPKTEDTVVFTGRRAWQSLSDAQVRRSRVKQERKRTADAEAAEDAEGSRPQKRAREREEPEPEFIDLETPPPSTPPDVGEAEEPWLDKEREHNDAVAGATMQSWTKDSAGWIGREMA